MQTVGVAVVAMTLSLLLGSGTAQAIGCAQALDENVMLRTMLGNNWQNESWICGPDVAAMLGNREDTPEGCLQARAMFVQMFHAVYDRCVLRKPLPAMSSALATVAMPTPTALASRSMMSPSPNPANSPSPSAGSSPLPSPVASPTSTVAVATDSARHGSAVVTPTAPPSPATPSPSPATSSPTPRRPTPSSTFVADSAFAEYGDLVDESATESSRNVEECELHLHAMEQVVSRNHHVADGLEQRCLKRQVTEQELHHARDLYRRQLRHAWCRSPANGSDQCKQATRHQCARHDELKDKWTASRTRLLEAIHQADDIQRAQSPSESRGVRVIVSHYLSAALANLVPPKTGERLREFARGGDD